MFLRDRIPRREYSPASRTVRIYKVNHMLTILLMGFILAATSSFNSGPQCHEDPPQHFGIIPPLWKVRRSCHGSQKEPESLLFSMAAFGFSLCQARIKGFSGLWVLQQADPFSLSVLWVTILSRPCLLLRDTLSWWPAQDWNIELWLTIHVTSQLLTF